MNHANADNGWKEFLNICLEMKNPQIFDHFFSLFLTYEERETMASRYLIIQALLEGKLTQREIAETYRVSIAQITRGSNALKAIDPEFKEQLKKLMSKTQ